MAVYEIHVISTDRFKVRIEAESPEQALERAERLSLTENSWYDGEIEYCDEDGEVVEVDDFKSDDKPETHEEGWKYIS